MSKNDPDMDELVPAMTSQPFASRCRKGFHAVPGRRKPCWGTRREVRDGKYLEGPCECWCHDGAGVGHTPIPWHLGEHNTVIYNGVAIARVFDNPQRDANAAFILHAVNEHDWLHQALEETQRRLA